MNIPNIQQMMRQAQQMQETLAREMAALTVEATAGGGMVTVTDEKGGTANVTIADVYQSNGVIHVVDKVLLPK